ncbi:peroxiredoxin [Hymenobacter persicinus]|uniref:thioredoxin-dependent peroxiredoxin n=1 Tax=Hymenobacter persicinus TaxID=2025506 RepID=A0A4Q5L935_9BACT|nr:peroxiredoxin [Hymenobacter persicinus]RYU78244.1 peroxiredoxin [Hymenobacter persicinus]
MLQVGDPAPDFSLTTTSGGTFHLADLRGRRSLVLYFYPKDDTPGCTAEACSFRDQYEDFRDLGAEVVGVSSDSEASHQKFTQKHRLPFELLADAGGRVRKLYEVPRAMLGLLPGRVTFVIDQQGIVRYIFNSLSGATDHVSIAKQVLQNLAAPSKAGSRRKNGSPRVLL